MKGVTSMLALGAQSVASRRCKTAQRLIFVLLLVPSVGAASCARETAANDPPGSAPGGSTSQATIMVAIGRAGLQVDDTNLDQKVGPAFGDGMSSGANNCYVDSLMKTPGQQGEITFVVKPPPGDGYYSVALEAQGSISAALVECVRRVFGAFYHYANKGTFDSFKGTLAFVPEMISAPAPPNEAALRAILDEQYARPGIVRIARSNLKSVTQEV